MTRRLAVAALMVACGLGFDPAAASAAIPGGIVQVQGVGGCVSNGGTGGCTSGHDLAITYDTLISPDGRNLYEVATGTNSLLVFDRDDATGQLAQKAGTAGCLRQTASANCQAVPLIQFPLGLAITPDGLHVYMANYASDSVLVFDRDPNTGALAQKPGTAGCIANVASASCTDARAMNGPVYLAVSADGKNLYVAALDGNSVTALSIAPSGALAQVGDGQGGSGCVQNVPDADGCADGRALLGAFALSIDPAGTTIYPAAFTDHSVSALARDPATGRLAPVSGATGCVDAEGTDGCTQVTDLSTIRDLTGAPGNGQLYVAVEGLNRVVTFDRLPSGGLVRRAGAAGCVSNGAVVGCVTGRGMASPAGIAASNDGQDIYVVSQNANSGIVELDRAADGSLSQRADARGCIVAGALGNCGSVFGLPSMYDVKVSPDNKYVYAASNAQGQIAVFKRDSEGPVCSDTTTTVQAGSVGPLPFPCSDRDGDPFNVSIINPPTLGSLGAIDNNAHTIVYAAPQGQSGSATFTFKAAYPNSTFESNVGSMTVNVVGASVVNPAPVGVDNDHDGFFAGQDCNDNDPKIRPGAVEIKGNRIDENCDGIAEPFATLTSGVATKWDVKGSRLSLTSLAISGLPSKWTAEIRCSGKGCPFKKKALKGKAKKGVANVTASLSKNQRKFKAKQVVEVWVSAPSFNTKVSRLVLKAGKIPTTTPLCVLPGGAKPQKTCS